MNNIVIIAAPSAAGKTTLIKRYMSEHSNAEFAVSHTTRAIREGEIEGTDYYFVSEEQFRAMIEASQFVEWADVHGNLYGTSISELEKAENRDIILILDIDVQGALFLKGMGISATYIFVSPPSIDDLKERLVNRGTETDESVKQRIWDAKREMEYTKEFDYVILNDDIDLAYQGLETYISSKVNNQ